MLSTRQFFKENAEEIERAVQETISSSLLFKTLYNFTLPRTVFAPTKTSSIINEALDLACYIRNKIKEVIKE